MWKKISGLDENFLHDLDISPESVEASFFAFLENWMENFANKRNANGKRK